METFRD